MDVVQGLLAEGAEVVAYDPVAGDQAVDLLPEMKLAPEPLDAVEGAHALVVMTGWPELGELDRWWPASGWPTRSWSTPATPSTARRSAAPGSP